VIVCRVINGNYIQGEAEQPPLRIKKQQDAVFFAMKSVIKNFSKKFHVVKNAASCWFLLQGGKNEHNYFLQDHCNRWSKITVRQSNKHQPLGYSEWMP